jgi:membrane protein DedA with SNARE-associated domain
VLASITSTWESHIASQGAYAVFVLMAIDAVFPAASELVMLYAGAVATGAVGPGHLVLFGSTIHHGAGAYVVMALAGTLGYLAGCVVGWAIGVYGGRPLLERHGRWLHLSPARLDRAEAWFGRWGLWAVPVGRITPIVRSFISIPAGVFEMRFVPYITLSLLGSAVWAFALSGVGYGLGSSYERFNHDFAYVEYAVIAGVVLCAAYLVYRWVTAARVSRRAADSAR